MRIRWFIQYPIGYLSLSYLKAIYNGCSAKVVAWLLFCINGEYEVIASLWENPFVYKQCPVEKFNGMEWEDYWAPSHRLDSELVMFYTYYCAMETVLHKKCRE